MHRAVFLLVVCVVGCQDSTTGIQTLCNAPRDCPSCQNVEPAQRDAAMAQHIDRSVRNDGARQLVQKLAKADDPTRAKLLRDAAERAGLSSCMLADRYDARAKAWQEHQDSGSESPPPE